MSTTDITQILEAVGSGDPQAAEQLLPVVYEDLRRMAAKKLSHLPAGQTLQATALVHEAYLRVVRSESEQQWDHRGHFFVAAAQAMRRILVDHIRSKNRLKRGGEFQRVDLAEAELAISIPNDQLLDLDDALTEFTKNNPKESELVHLRYFAGLSLEEAASVMGISRATASRYWAYARARLFAAMSKGDDPDDTAKLDS